MLDPIEHILVQVTRNVLIIWPFMSNPLADPTTPPKLISRIAQAGIITNHKEISNKDEDYSKRKHNPKMPQIVPIGKLYLEQKGRPSLIGDAGRLFIG
jgi:hypothetical protein